MSGRALPADGRSCWTETREERDGRPPATGRRDDACRAEVEARLAVLLRWM